MTSNQKVWLSIVMAFLAVLLLPPILGELIMKAAKKEKPEKGIEVVHLKVVEFDGCEYIETNVTASFRTYTHKGNCKNSFHNIH